eukprot:gene4091-5153_t
MSAISSLGHRFEAVVGFDLAHAVGNVPLHLHDWGCDFACWCSYKYLNCGPGSIGGCFVHDKHLNDNDGGPESHIDSAPLSSPSSEDTSCKERSSAAATGRVMPRLTGWWGHRLETRFLMNPLFDPCHGANAFRLSNPSVLLVASLRASLDIFDQTDMKSVRQKSVLLTGYLEHLLTTQLHDVVEIFTPADPNRRGAQLSLRLVGQKTDVEEVYQELKRRGVICDTRKPD